MTKLKGKLSTQAARGMCEFKKKTKIDMENMVKSPKYQRTLWISE